MANPKVTTDHEEIRHWVEEHEGRPATETGSVGKNEGRVVKIFFPDQYTSNPVEEITWDEFFEKFEQEDLAFMYKEDEDSRFFRIVER